MDTKEHDLSDDGHFLSDTDDEYNEDYEEWDEAGDPEENIRKQKESELSKLDEHELLRLAAVNADVAHDKTKETDSGLPCNAAQDVELEQNRQAWLAMKKPIIGKRPGKKKNSKRDDKIKNKSKGKDTPKSKEETDLEKLAFDEIVKEAKRGKERSEEMGPSGWQKPRVTNKRFLQNTLLSTLPRKRRKDDGQEVPRSYSDSENDSTDKNENDEGIKPEVGEKIDEYRRKRSQHYEDEKYHKRQQAEERRNHNKAVKQAEKEKKKYDNVMRYGVKIGAKRERARQENKRAIFDRYHGVWMQLDRTYHRHESRSDNSESDEDNRRSTEDKKFDKYNRDEKYVRNEGRVRGRGYYHHSMDRNRAWQAYYAAAAYNYYKYMQEYHSDRKYSEQKPSGSDEKYYRYRSGHTHKYSDESDAEHSDRNSKRKRRKHKKHKKHKKKSKKSRKQRSKTSESDDNSDFRDEKEHRGHSSQGKYKETGKSKYSQDNDSQDSESDSELSDIDLQSDSDIEKRNRSDIRSQRELSESDRDSAESSSSSRISREKSKEKHRSSHRKKSKHRK